MTQTPNPFHVPPASLAPAPALPLYRTMLRIRRFEETVLENFSRGIFSGTTHTYLGQEANAAGVLSHLQAQDIVLSNHRGHGHFIAYGGDLQALFAELMGKSTGVCGGRGGSQHLQFRNFYSNGIQGGIVPTAVGMALAEKHKFSHSVTVVFLGDGTLGEGIVYEALNMASLWQAPVLFVLENNHIAQTTPIELAVSGSILGRFEAFGIPCTELNTSDVLAISSIAEQLFINIRQGLGPHALIIHTNRFGPHSKGDDTRPARVVAAMRKNSDPLSELASKLDPPAREQIEAEVEQEINSAFNSALADPLPFLEQM